LGAVPDPLGVRRLNPFRARRLAWQRWFAWCLLFLRKDVVPPQFSPLGSRRPALSVLILPPPASVFSLMKPLLMISALTLLLTFPGLFRPFCPHVPTAARPPAKSLRPASFTMKVSAGPFFFFDHTLMKWPFCF